MKQATLVDESSEPSATDDFSALMQKHAVAIDHIAIAVPDLEKSVAWYRDVLGFRVTAKRTTQGRHTAMDSAVMEAGPVTLVLVQGTTPESQVSRYIERYGPGVQHVAIQVLDLPAVMEQLEAEGLSFDTNIIQGDGIRQSFTHRDPDSGMMFELIERQRPDGRFTDESVQSLFRQLEATDAF